MLLASKYEDILPFTMNLTYEKIAHKAFTKEQIKRKEKEIITLLDFDLSLVTPYDFALFFL
jgi:hypothetical protein